MTRLQRADLEALLTFLGDVAELEFDEPYSVEVVVRLQDLVHCDALTYQELDLHAKRFYALVGIGPDGEDDDEELYWTVGPCPISDYRARTGDLCPVTMSDVIGRRRYHELPIYREYFQPAGHWLQRARAEPVLAPGQDLRGLGRATPTARPLKGPPCGPSSCP